MSKAIFITGTSTDIGKTFVTTLIIKKLQDNNIKAGYYKPALSGSQKVNNKLIPIDAKYVCDNSHLNEPPESLVSYIYETPVSPHLASEIEKNPVDKNVILQDFNKIKSVYDYTTVEGCGGIICPLRMDNQPLMLTDIIKMLNLDIIIVAGSELGTINSTVLTVEYAKKMNITVKAIIMNHFDAKNFLHIDNKKQIEKLTNIPIIACVSKNDSLVNIDIEKLKKLYKEI